MTHRSRIPPALRAAVALALLLAGCLPAVPTGDAPGGGREAAPAPPLWGVVLEGHPITAARLQEVEREMGLTPQLVTFFLQWPAERDLPAAEAGAFPRESVEAIWQRGAVPCLTWEPMSLMGPGQEVAIPHAAVTGGRYDGFLRAFAREARRWEKPLLIRFAHEMNLARYHWGTDAAGYGPDSPRIYRDLFRYVVSRFREEGAGNVLWVFCPNAESLPDPARDGAAWNAARHYYPGGAWVDLLGMDGYNWGTTQTRGRHGWDSAWRSFPEIFEPLRRELTALAPEKPLLVFETSSAAAGGDRTAWVREALAAARAWRLQGVGWFQADKETDWRLLEARDGEAVAALRQATSPAQAWAEGLRRR